MPAFAAIAVSDEEHDVDDALEHVGPAAAEGHDAHDQGQKDHDHVRLLDAEHVASPAGDRGRRS